MEGVNKMELLLNIFLYSLLINLNTTIFIII